MTSSLVKTSIDLSQGQDSVRHVLADFFNRSFSHKLPVEWENMPPLSPLPAAGWVRFRVEFDQIAPIGLKPAMLLQRGHLQFLVAVAIGHGMAGMDTVSMEITTLFAGRTISSIHLGNATLQSPVRQQGFHLRALNIDFSAVIPPR
ncbi:hypothetical protein AB8880_02065 [Alphaproteobacteria bacterium LSUCC0684]